MTHFKCTQNNLSFSVHHRKQVQVDLGDKFLTACCWSAPSLDVSSYRQHINPWCTREQNEYQITTCEETRIQSPKSLRECRIGEIPKSTHPLAGRNWRKNVTYVTEQVQRCIHNIASKIFLFIHLYFSPLYFMKSEIYIRKASRANEYQPFENLFLRNERKHFQF